MKACKPTIKAARLELFRQSYKSRLLLLQVSSVNRGWRVHEVTQNQANVAIACRIRRYLTMLWAEGGVLSILALF